MIVCNQITKVLYIKDLFLQNKKTRFAFFLLVNPQNFVCHNKRNDVD